MGIFDTGVMPPVSPSPYERMRLLWLSWGLNLGSIRDHDSSTAAQQLSWSVWATEGGMFRWIVAILSLRDGQAMGLFNRTTLGMINQHGHLAVPIHPNHILDMPVSKSPKWDVGQGKVGKPVSSFLMLLFRNEHRTVPGQIATMAWANREMMVRTG